MRIAFDGTTLRPEQTGVGYYTEHLLHHLAQDPDTDLVVLSNRPVWTSIPLASRVRIETSRRPLQRAIWMQTLAPARLRSLKPDIAHFTNSVGPCLAGVPFVVTIHDMSLTLFPSYHPLRRILLSRPLMKVTARRAAAIITVSESARRDIVWLCGVPPDRVHVVHEAAAPHFHPVRDRAILEPVRARYALADRFVLYVGTVEPRKNLVRLLQAFARLKRDGLPHQLVCVGPLGWRYHDVRAAMTRLNLGSNLLLTGYVPFDDLPAIYSLAEAFVFPSLYEGFGLPVVEAMACGTPVITSTTSSLGEISEGVAERIDPLEVDDIARAIRKVTSDGELRRDLALRGLERARRFSWMRAASETLDVYRTAIGWPARSEVKNGLLATG
ncbi:MAG: glycosyltransferase family 4 protein [Acidobacteria bacterium]|nr:glycosyltransferase family 4 protein [Acidobacteriota bacterium]